MNVTRSRSGAVNLEIAKGSRLGPLFGRNMNIDVSLVPLEVILPLRELYRQEMNCQIVHDSWHRRGFTDSYLIKLDGGVAGYGSVGGVGDEPKDLIKEFYVLPVHRAAAMAMFRRLAAASGARRVEAQTNDTLLTLMLFDCADAIESETILFHDAITTSLSVPGATFRKVAEKDEGKVFDHSHEPVGDWLIEAEGQIAATGGMFYHYNVPYGDIFMEVAVPFRQRGYGSYLVQELKRTCYELGKIPAARCHVSNVASRATLQKAGLLPCARILRGVLTG
jgi:GNAT superfamily N-acetyltransferase